MSPSRPSFFSSTNQDTARFPHNLITAKRPKARRRGDQGFNAAPAPDVNDESAFPDIGFASSAAALKQKAKKGAAGAVADSGRGAGGQQGEGYLGSSRDREEEEDEGGWDGQGRIEEAQIVSGR